MTEKQTSRVQSWTSVGRWTLLGTSGCILASLAFNSFAFGGLGQEAMRRSLVSATVLPLVLGAPLFFFISARMRGLMISNRRLGKIARTDSLTLCLNRGAFTTRVNAALDSDDPDQLKGALLMIDADNFKSINDQFGHDAGDEALRLIVRSIRSVLRTGDLLGRMGGEEFGVFLPHSDFKGAETVAERIRRSVNLAVFTPGDVLRPISVSIGGAVFEGATTFTDLFRIADQRLYGAKDTGRNRVKIAYATDHPEILSRAS
ncbi:GGDEF domain-containing protein [Devosia sp.]|uniref:GGDEF domain-containing protein n=1 Tax=Devosia sp. TaxID=1871048 RepID=UPI003267CE46